MAAYDKYGHGAVYGSLAYDFDNPVLEPEAEYGVPLERPAPREREREKTGVRTHAHAAARARQGIPLFAITGILFSAALFVVAIMAQVQLVDISAQTVKLQSQLAELETEQSKLQIKYESVFNLTEIEEYATTKLGMQKPSADQIYYIDTSSADRAVVVAGGESSGFIDRVSDFISGIASYFR